MQNEAVPFVTSENLGVEFKIIGASYKQNTEPENQEVIGLFTYFLTSIGSILVCKNDRV